MLLAFVIVIIMTGLAILSSVYSMFAPFVDSFGDIVNYNVAYYGAISAVERGELALKYKGPGFVGSGGWIDQNTFGKPSDIVTDGFSIKFENRNGMLWNIDSRTQRIPNLGEGNIDRDFLWSGYNSENYNKLGYKGVETILLSLDDSSLDSFYSGTSTPPGGYGGTYISGQFRLPPKVVSGFNNSLLCNDNSVTEICDPDQDGLYDDTIVYWSLKGYYGGKQFFVMPNESVAYYGTEKSVNTDQDTVIRETNINALSGIIFGDSKNIFDAGASLPSTQNFDLNHDYLSGDTFEEIFSNPDYTGMQLKFTLINFLTSFSGSMYPFLEYFLVFDRPVADRFYTIQGNGRKGDYDIKIIIKKPTFKETVAGSFTVVF